MTARIDPFEALEPYARHLLRATLAGRDPAHIAQPRHARLVRALRALLGRDDTATPGGAQLRAALLRQAPDLAPHVALLERCAERLPDVLSGRALASDVMFPAGSMDLVEPVYRGNRWSDHFNRLTATASARAVGIRREQDPSATVRVLEVGAGTGGTSAAVLAALEPHGAHLVYDYTDISPGFVQHGKRVHGAGRPFLAGRLLDLEKPPEAQGFAAGSYDLVLATNVLHATSRIGAALAHINRLLRAGGLLLLNEITRSGAFATMTFGLLDGWWAFRDAELRLPDAPVLAPSGWRQALAAAGFNDPAVYGWTDRQETSFQCLFIAAKQREAAAEATPAQVAAVAPPPPAEIASDLRGLLAARLASLLGLDPGEIAADRPLSEFGVDSIVAPQFVALLNRELGATLAPSDVFNAATLAGMAELLNGASAPPRAAPPQPAAEAPLAEPAARNGTDIAVIGLACRFPGARDAEAFWHNLRDGRCSITEVPPSRWDAREEGKPRWGGFLDDHDCFDPEFFNLSWREAEAMSPQQRVFLEQAWNALENAGYGRRSLAGLRCGVFVGAAPDGYGINQNDSLSSLGGSLAILAARISYLLDLKGPSLPLDTACSSSLVAVHLACQSLLAGDCDMALAGGVSILMTDTRLHGFLDDAGMLSPTGRCHTFDAAADGFVPGEGAGVVVLKRLDQALADGDAIAGVIKGSGINQDGRTSGITAPSGKAQTALECAVYERAGIDPAAIRLVEAHGTGTQLGDPIEVNALAAAFRRATDRQGFCALGSVKTNIGHTLTAAGVAGLIKVLLALRHRTIPPSLHFASANPEIDFARSPFFVPRQAMPWTEAPRLAAVSSFGFSGTNAHVVVAEAPPVSLVTAEAGPALILLSARSEAALAARREDLQHWLETATPSLPDLAYTLSHGRSHFEHRLALVVDSIADLRAWHGPSWESPPLVLPTRGGEDAELAALLAAPVPDLARIAACYVRGGDGDWSRLAAPGARRLALPGYRFAAQRFPTRPQTPLVSAPRPQAHPLLAADISGAGGGAFRLKLDADAPWLRDHRLDGGPVLPAVACLELARAAAALARGAPVCGLAGVRLARPLRAQSDTEARIILREASDAVGFEVIGGGNAVHASGRASFAPAAAAPPPADLGALAARLPNRFSADDVYAAFRRLGFEYGPSFRVIRGLRADGAGVLADLAPVEAPAPGMQLDPALLDGAVQAAVGLMLVSGEALSTVVPVAIGEVAILGAVTGPCRAHVALLAGDADRRHLDISVLDPDGKLLVRLHDVAVRVTRAAPAGDAVLTFAPVWEAAPLPPAAAPADLLVFDRDETMWRRLGDGAILVRPGSAFCRLERRSFAIDPASAEDYRRLGDVLRADALLPDTIWHCWSRTAASGDPRHLDEAAIAAALRDGLQSVFHLCAALAQRTPARPLTLLHVHAAADEAPLHAPVAGLAAALARENPMLQLASVGVAAGEVARLVACLAAETAAARAAAPDRHGRAACWDAGGGRSVRRLRPTPLPAARALRPRGVFLLTGALGGIGRHIATHLAARCAARLVLVGRKPAGAEAEALIAAIRAAGGDAVYQAADIADPAQAAAAVACARSRFGALHGVIHAAGVTRDRFLLHKTAEDRAAVLAPKLAGTLALDRATADQPLDVFACFSSLAGSLGNAGQTDYSAANRFLDAFMAARSGPGRSLAIGWPYWREGGLAVDEAEQERRAAATGIRSLGTDEALAVFDALIGGAEGSVLVLPGDAAAIGALVEGRAPAPMASAPPADPAPADDETALAYLRKLLARATAMPEARIHADRPLEQYGIDSILVTKLNLELERDFGALPKTLFYEHQTLRSAAQYLAARHAGTLAVVRDPPAAPAAAPAPARPAARPPDGIAIIGIAGRYPGADTLEAFWDNLRADRDLITEIPPERWNHAAWFDPRPGTPGRSYSKWGGFLSGVDLFDPLFFAIAPGEAAGIDPNERLFLEICWEALENSGHTRASLTRDPARSVGVYAGVMYGEYQLLAAAAQAAGAAQVGGAAPYWSIANRVSYHLDLHGPSIAVDSACSSSLTAIHLACQALATGECAAAIAGGVNLSLHPLKYVGLSQGRFAASDGRCHSFAAGGDGYVPGEGVGAVVLKPLAAALADGDYVHAVIRGWAANHGGKTNGYTVPNPALQGGVIAAALRRGGIPPASISYVEAHGTGTALGDPIEVAGLAAAFGAAVPPQSCALGSVKANIGHLEAAAGIAGLTRVVLQLRHRTLTPTRLHGPANPNIDLAATPFRLQDRTEAWTASGPLRAGISSFGAGGSNAHLVVEEFRMVRAAPAEAGPALLLLSARTEVQLRAYAERMAAFLPHSPFRLADVCRTLQLGREPMAARLALVAATLRDAAEALAAFLRGEAGDVLIGEADDAAPAAAVAPSAGLHELAQAWVAGARIDWPAVALPGETVPLPAHPFMRRRYWLEQPGRPAVPRAAALHPFLDRAEPSLDGAVLVKRFDPADPVVRDHRVQGRLLVPGVVQLEMARAAVAATGRPAAVLRDVVWSAPLAVPAEGAETYVTLRRTGEEIGFEISLAGTGAVCRGRAAAGGATAAEQADIAALRAAATRHLPAEAIYARLAALGLEYGPSLRALRDIWASDATVLAELAAAPPADGVALPPCVLDGALQSLLGFAAADAERLLVPFALAEARLLGDLAAARFVVATRRAAEDGVALFDLAVCDADGRTLLRLDRLGARPGAAAQSAVPVALAIRHPVWRAEPAAHGVFPEGSAIVVHGGEDFGVTARLAASLGAARVADWHLNGDAAAAASAIAPASELVWIAAAAGPDIAGQAEALALDLLNAIQALERAGRLGQALRLRIVTRSLQSVSPRERPDPRAAAVLGLAKSIALEFPRLAVTLADFDAPSLADARLPQFLLGEPASLPVREVAWRDGVRHFLTMQPISLPAPLPPLRRGAVALIVGGAGGIGREIAAWLARECAARVALVGRRPAADIAAGIAGVPSGAGEIRYFQADATDPAAMAEVVAELRALWGGIDAAIHAALVLRDRTLARMDEATFRAVLAPKLAGSVVLAEALAGEALQFLAFLSSVNVISGSRGQANYVAASSFVDAYARHLAAERPWRVVVTDWGLWGEVGVVSDETYRRRLARQGVHPIAPAEGVAAFAAVLAGTIDRVAIARAEPAALRQLGLEAPAAELPALERAEAAFAALERYGRVALRDALLGMAGLSGKAWTTEGLRRGLGVAPRHAALFAALLDALARDGLVDAADGLWRLGPARPELLAAAGAALDAAARDAPWLAGPRRLLQACLDAYPALLRGEADPVAVLFPRAAMDLVEAAYSGNPIADHFNARIAEAAHAHLAARPAGTRLQVIELGAGTGSTTAAVLEALAPFAERIDYLATDLSQRFIAHGEARFAGRPGLRFALYDAERDPAQNGVPVGGFDLVIAANVLHATADLAATLARVRRLLRPGGELLLSEATRAQDFGTLVFGLTQGWWLATDPARRIPHAPLATVEGWRTLLAEAGFAASRAVTAGSGAAPHALLIAENREAFAPAAAPLPAPPAAAPRPPAASGAASRLHDHLRAILADVLKLEPDEVRLNESFDRYGLESLTALEIRNRLDRDIPGLPATLLFEHNTLARLAAWLAETHAEAVAALFPPAVSVPAAAPPQPAPAERPPVRRAAAAEPIAIIGWHGRYPGGPDPDAFWRLLYAGASAIGEIPADRFDAGASFDSAGGEGRSYTRWAGFIDGIDRFDPLFFNIAPLEAEVMDPQERLFLEVAWATLEQAGYAPRRLRATAGADCPDGGDVGVFVGVMNAPYQWIAAEAWAAGHASAASTGYWSIANRVSFLLDLCGPSLVVDTACSASLTAIHLACESLRRGECGAALAGGVNLILHPRQFVNLSQARMVSRGAECRAFGAGADGFVDGEGVGAVLLKPLAAAERDGDRIEAVILGSAVNAGGRTSGFTVPSPKAQARVIRAALRRAGAAPETISYVEAHGTGTALGDPIEIAGLAEAYGGAGRPRCAIGAVKANIGHLESAAGIAGLTKVLLQMRHRTIVPCRHAAQPNPLIDFAATPFVLPTEPIEWRPSAPGGRLRAGLSSFGAGGANAHLVIEDYPPRAAAAAAAAGGGPVSPDLVVLSARDDERLRAVAANLLAALGATPPPLADLAHTLRVGREAMAARLAILARDAADLEAKLAAWLAGTVMPEVLVGAPSGSAARLAETEEGRALLAGLLARADLARLGQLWAEGAEIDWAALPARGAPRLLALPGYPFRRERYWLTPAATAAPGPEPAAPRPAPVAEPLPPAAEQPVRTQLFARTWQPAASLAYRPATPLLVLARDPALAATLAALWPAEVRAIRPGRGFAVVDGRTLAMDPAAEDDHAALIAHLARSEPDGFAIIQALDWPNVGDPAAGDGPLASILLTQAVQRSELAQARILHLYADAEQRPLDQAVGALARSAMQEREGGGLRAVGIAGPAAVAAAAAICRDELLAADAAPEVLHADGVRRLPGIELVTVAPSASTIGFRIGGAYLLVGGLGEVGSAVAERLGRDYRARIAIIGRSDPRGPALARLRRLRDAGIQVHYAACDLTDRAGLQRALKAIRGQLGRLHGVLHLARTVEDALLVRKTSASLARVMAAKVAGSIALDAALNGEELDWFVLCSSLAAWLGLAGGGDYALACAFQSGFARLRQQKVERGERSGRTVAICWPQWRHDRYLNDAKLRRLAAEGLQTIDARDGLRIIAQALQSGRTEVAAVKGSEQALHRLTQVYRQDAAPVVAAPAEDDVAAELSRLSDAELAAYLDHLAPPEPPQAAPMPQAAGETPERAILDTICGFLKLPPERFTAQSGFAEFGLDSIKALHVAERLQKRLGVPVDPAMFYEYPKVGEFAQALAARSAPPARAQR